MADFRFSQGAGTHYYAQYNQQPQQPQPHHPRHQITRNITPPNNLRAAFETPSPTRSPNSPAYGMFSQGHQGQHGRVNGAGRGIPMMYNYQHQNSHQQQHTQHHPGLQQEHSGPHNTNGIGHHSSFPSGVLSNNAPSFTPNSLQNGQAGTTRGGQAQQITEHWAEQLTQHKEAQKIHQAMIEQGAPNHFARVKAGENKGLSTAANNVETRNDPDEEKDPARMAETLTVKRRQDWSNLDLSGQGLRIITPPLFNFDFLTELYISSNKLTSLPPAIGKLRMLRHLDASNNSLVELPVELGLCVKLKTLLLFDNRITTLPYELGSLFKLEMLGIEGNADFDQDLRQEIMEKGTVAMITHLRENAPSMFTSTHIILAIITNRSNQSLLRLRNPARSSNCKKALHQRIKINSKLCPSISLLVVHALPRRMVTLQWLLCPGNTEGRRFWTRSTRTMQMSSVCRRWRRRYSMNTSACNLHTRGTRVSFGPVHVQRRCQPRT